jgi:putative (di)nucleoside polyphosphate hydrolase
MSINQYFRAGVGTVIYNAQGKILVFSRSNRLDIWQMQQGGMDAGESFTETLWRELEEETGLTQEDIATFSKYPTWLYYEYPEHIKSGLKDQNTLGQIHQWFFLKLKPDTIVNLDKAVDKEFADYMWSEFSELIAANDKLKLAVYKELQNYFDTHIRPSL